MSEIKLTKQDRIHVFLRSNLHQGSWNFERMQALGYCYAMIPAIKRLYPVSYTHLLSSHMYI